MIEVSHLTKRYGTHTAIADLSFHIEKGQIYGLLGPNGAGKSTTMNIMTGCLSASSGSVTVGGHDIFEEAGPAKRLLGYLPERPPLYLDRTPWEYLSFVGQAKGVAKEDLDEQIHHVMEVTRIADVSQRLIKNLSKGYQQRVGIAQALLGDPEVVILDEPTVGLDPKQIIEIRSLIRDLGHDHTVILSSHILSEVQAVCQTILILSHGKLVACDTPAGLEKRFAGGGCRRAGGRGRSRGGLPHPDPLGPHPQPGRPPPGGRRLRRHLGNRPAPGGPVPGSVLRLQQRPAPPPPHGRHPGQPGGHLPGTHRRRHRPPPRWGGSQPRPRGGCLMKAVFRHELATYFTGLTGYVFGAFLLLFGGIYTMVICLNAGSANFEYVLSNLSFIFLIIVPILTMRVIAEEKRQKTDQLLYSLPLSMTGVTLGKYAAMVVIFLIPTGVLCVYPLLLTAFGSIYLPAVFSTVVGFVFLGAALLAIGMFLSSITESQGVAAGLCFVVLLVCYFLPDLSDYFSTSAFASFAAFTVVVLLIGLIFRLMTRNTPVSVTLMVVLEVALILGYGLGGDSFAGLFPSLVEELSLFEKFYQFVDGIFDVRCLVYFLTVILVFLFLTVQSLEKRRWSE